MRMSDSECKLWEGSIGVDAGLGADKPVPYERSKQYFLWHRYMPWDDLCISKPMKYLRWPKTLILNFSCKINLIWMKIDKYVPTRIKMST